MEQKYILTQEDLMKLSLEERNAYNRFFDTIYDKGIIYESQLKAFNEILQKQYKASVLFNPNSLERYPEILAKNLQNIIDIIAVFRNETIGEKRVFDQYNFKLINEGLEVLKKFIETYLNSSHYKFSIGIGDLESLLPKIEQLKNQVSIDIQFYSDYRDKKMKAKFDYEYKKEQYDSLSLFGKLVAKINGKKKELEASAIKAWDYDSVKFDRGEKSDIINPWKYEQYIEEHQEEQTIGGKNR